jgi:hypothetical protein
MSRRHIGLILVLALALAVAIPVLAITWGEPDNNEHPHVGTLLFVQNGQGFYSCTGTMISPTVMLTAGHCVAGSGNINDVTYVRFDDDALSGIGDYGSLQEWFDADWIEAETVIPHPNWDDYANFPYTYDIGLVILPDPYTPLDSEDKPIFGELPDPGFLETLKGKDKNHFTVVGYGMQGNLKPFAQNDYEKYKGNVRLVEVKSYLTAGGAASAKFSNNPGIGGGTCYGDSGGPNFFADTNIVSSITSFGWAKNGKCVGNSFYYRTDTPDALDFINLELSKHGY